MGKFEVKKQAIVRSISKHLLEQGLNHVSIRELGEAAGTSDRMLIYYFDSKDQILDETLSAIAAGFTQQLDELLGTHSRSAQKLLDELLAVNSAPEMRPAINLWFELVGLAARNKEPYLSNANALAENWIDWIESRLRQGGKKRACELFATVEGRMLLQVIGVAT